MNAATPAFSLLLTPAFAESAYTLPKAAQLVYAGPAVNTWHQLQLADDRSGALPLDRGLRTRLDLYFARGLGDRLTVAAYVPVVHSRVLDDEHDPCPDSDGFEALCSPFTTVGGVAVQARYRAVDRPFVLTPLLSVGSDAWNARYQGRYTAFGDASTDLVAGGLAGYRSQLGGVDWEVLGFGEYALRMGRTVDFEGGPTFTVPPDHVRMGGEVHLAPQGRLSFELGASSLQRLWGIDWDSTYEAVYYPTNERWSVLWSSYVAATAKVSCALADDTGLHLSVFRTVAVRNGPTDVLDVSLGVHHTYGPGR